MTRNVQKIFVICMLLMFLFSQRGAASSENDNGIRPSRIISYGKGPSVLVSLLFVFASSGQYGYEILPVTDEIAFISNDEVVYGEISRRIQLPSEFRIRYWTTYAFEEEKFRNVKFIVIDPEGVIYEREEEMLMGEKDEDEFEAIFLSESGLTGEYSLELFIDDQLMDSYNMSVG